MDIQKTIEIAHLNCAVRDTCALLEKGNPSQGQVDVWRAYVSECLARIAELSQ